MGNRSWDEWVAQYATRHQHRWKIASHAWPATPGCHRGDLRRWGAPLTTGWPDFFGSPNDENVMVPDAAISVSPCGPSFNQFSPVKQRGVRSRTDGCYSWLFRQKDGQ